jgi:hypothetical protein
VLLVVAGRNFLVKQVATVLVLPVRRGLELQVHYLAPLARGLLEVL